MSDKPNAHTLTLKFHRFLSEVEWRAVVESARLVPYMVELVANAVQETPEELAHKRLPIYTLAAVSITNEPSDWFQPVTLRIDDKTGLEISEEEWQRWTWYDVTTHANYKPGVHRYVRMKENDWIKSDD